MALLGNPIKRRTSPRHKTTTIRQFDGGWNVIDNELTLSPRYARIFDNMMRGPDGSVSVRYGYALWKDLKLGTFETVTPTLSFSTTALSRRVTVHYPTHFLLSGHHVTLSGVPDINGIPAADLNRTHSIRDTGTDTFDIITKTAATSTGGPIASAAYTVERDSHAAGGSIINGTYFQNFLICVTSIGEVIALDGEGNSTIIWNNAIAAQLAGNPAGWSETEFVSFHVFGGNLLIHNGIDKPLEVNMNNSPPVVFLGDPASGGSNANVPVGRYGFSSSSGYALIGGITEEPSKLQISANLSSGVWTGNPAPDDAVDVDMSKISGSFEVGIVGIAELRDKIVVAFRDTISIGTLGLTKIVGSATLHDPVFKDTVAQHGAVSNRSIVSLGNDLFMCDRIGVPSISQSSVSGQLVPDRVSDLIEPALQTNIARLSDKTLTDKVFALYNPRERQYMLFMPKFDPLDTNLLDAEPIAFLRDFPTGHFMVQYQAHGLEEGDDIVISGATPVGLNASVNGSFKVATVIDDDLFTVDSGVPTAQIDVTGGGSNVSLKRATQDTIGYIFSYNPKLKIRAWSRFRGWNFAWGTKSAYGGIFMGRDRKIYRLGTRQLPYSADAIGDYDYSYWTHETEYSVGTKVYDPTVRKVFIALEAHTSSPWGTFAETRDGIHGLWEEYPGDPIKFTWEWPWADFDKRLKSKQIVAVYPDSSGQGSFDLKLFADLLYKDGSGALTPVRSLTFTGADAAGYGAGPQPYGGGRRTKEQLIWPLPVVAKLTKVRIEGETTDPLRIIAVSIVYKEGSMKR